VDWLDHQRLAVEQTVAAESAGLQQVAVVAHIVDFLESQLAADCPERLAELAAVAKVVAEHTAVAAWAAAVDWIVVELVPVVDIEVAVDTE